MDCIAVNGKVGFDKAVEYFTEKQNDNYVRI